MQTGIKILIAEHDSTDLELLHYELTKCGFNYTSEVVQNEQDYINALENFLPDIILSDFTFPSFNGPTAFSIREQLAPDTPFIFVSGTIGEEKSIELIKTGVTDYVLKDKLFTLNFKITRALKEAKEKEQAKNTQRELFMSEGRLVRAQRLAHLGNWELDFSTNIVTLSDEAFNIFGLRPSQSPRLSYDSWLSFIHPDDFYFASGKIKDAINSFPDLSVSYRIIRSNGTIRHIYSEGKLEFDLHNRSTGLYGIIHDVTEKVLLEKELAKERRSKQSEITAAVFTAQENERAAIELELHENLNQILGATKLHIEMAKTDEGNKQLFLEKSAAYIGEVMDEIRKISKLLSTPDKRMGLSNSIKNLLSDLSLIHPVKIEFLENNIDETFLNEKLQLTIFRIVQEQVTNILKHAKATRAIINLSMLDNEIILLISDNGEGTDLLKEINGVGIKNIKVRADLYNGTVTIASNSGKGYKLRVALTLDAEPPPVNNTLDFHLARH